MSAAQKLIQDWIESYELVREHGVQKIGKRAVGDAKLRDEALSFFSRAAAEEMAFAAEQCGKIASMAIIGPTHKPGSVHAFEPDGKLLYCHYVLVHPRWRVLGRWRPLVREMVQTALLRFPETESFCYFRHNGSEYKEILIASDRTLGVRPWVGPRSDTAAMKP